MTDHTFTPAQSSQVRQTALNFDVEDYVRDYEFRGEVDYKPTPAEQELLIDAIHGVLAEIVGYAGQSPASLVGMDAIVDIVMLAMAGKHPADVYGTSYAKTMNLDVAKRAAEKIAALFANSVSRSSAETERALRTSEEALKLANHIIDDLRRKLKLSDNLLDGLTTTVEELKAELAEAHTWVEPQSSAVGLTNLAETIHEGRYGPDYPEDLKTPFEDERSPGREYCLRIARRIMDTYSVTRPHRGSAE